MKLQQGIFCQFHVDLDSLTCEAFFVELNPAPIHKNLFLTAEVSHTPTITFLKINLLCLLPEFRIRLRKADLTLHRYKSLHFGSLL